MGKVGSGGSSLQAAIRSTEEQFVHVKAWGSGASLQALVAAKKNASYHTRHLLKRDIILRMRNFKICRRMLTTRGWEWLTCYLAEGWTSTTMPPEPALVLSWMGVSTAPMDISKVSSRDRSDSAMAPETFSE